MALPLITVAYCFKAEASLDKSLRTLPISFLDLTIDSFFGPDCKISPVESMTSLFFFCKSWDFSWLWRLCIAKRLVFKRRLMWWCWWMKEFQKRMWLWCRTIFGRRVMNWASELRKVVLRYSKPLFFQCSTFLLFMLNQFLNTSHYCWHSVPTFFNSQFILLQVFRRRKLTLVHNLFPQSLLFD